MPRLSQWMIRVAFLYLLVGLSIGLLMILAKARFLSPVWWRLHPIHIECLQVGWIFHLALGVAYWMFPRIQRVLRPRSYLAWASFGLLNFSIGLYSVGALWWGERWQLLSRLLECLALALFVIHLWPRIKSFREPKT